MLIVCAQGQINAAIIGVVRRQGESTLLSEHFLDALNTAAQGIIQG